MPTRKTDLRSFRTAVWDHYRAYKRNLPWRNTKDPYHIFVSEVMLQQTQVKRVTSKYREFLRHFPNLTSLAKASIHEVMRIWQGLGYNRRAISLRDASRIMRTRFRGAIPRDPKFLENLPGIGHGTAGAILVFAFNIPYPFIETNIRRVFIKFFFPRKRKVSDKEILPLIEETMDRKNPREWFYALMDYGAMLGGGAENPNRKSAHYRKQAPFAGSVRQLRGKIVRVLLIEGPMPRNALRERVAAPRTRFTQALQGLQKDNVVQRKNKKLVIRR